MKKEIKNDKLISILKEITENEGIFTLTVTGTSMTPTLYSNRDFVNLVTPKKNSPRKYDIVLFQRKDGNLVLHRIIKIVSENIFIVNGDSQQWTETVKKDQILAVVDNYIRNGKIIKRGSFKFCSYSAVWCKLKPLRPLILKILSYIKN